MIKVNVSDKGKTLKLELDLDLSGKKLGDKIQGEEITPDLAGYELEITGASDSSGFPYSKTIEGQGKKKLLLKKGKFMQDFTEGIRRKRTVRGNTLSQATAQLNLKVLKHGNKKFEDMLPKKEEVKAEEKPAQ